MLEHLDEVDARLFALASDKGLHIKISVSSEIIVVPTNRRSLSQILINLDNNAVKFTKPDRQDSTAFPEYDPGISESQGRAHWFIIWSGQ